MLNYVVGGWVMNSVSIFQTGFPLQISQSTNFNSSFGYASQRPNATGLSPVTSGSLEQRLGDYINPAAFSTAPEFTFGNVGRTIDMRGPGQVNFDMSLFKNFAIRRARQIAVPLRSAQRHEHAALLWAERFLRQQLFRDDHVPGELLAATAVGAALLVLTREHQLCGLEGLRMGPLRAAHMHPTRISSCINPSSGPPHHEYRLEEEADSRWTEPLRRAGSFSRAAVRI